jgi:Protein of unknown function (DUF1420)
VIELWAYGTLICAAFGLGAALLSLLDTPRERKLEFLALAGAAGLGTLAAFLGVLGLLGRLHAARWLIPIGALATLIWVGLRWRRLRPPVLNRPSVGTILLVAMVGAAFLGALAPTTDDDSLAYPIPIAQHLARDGRWRFWPDQALSTYPLSQEFLEAALLDAGARRLGPLSALECMLSGLLLVSLGRRIGRDSAAPWLAAVIALGCPAVAFLASSAKEDMLLITMTVASAVALYQTPGVAAALTAGMFAGFAAGAKYPGAPVPLAVVACVPFCCGRERPRTTLVAAAVAACAAGGLWYAVNLARFGNPVAPFLPSIGHPPVSPTAMREWLSTAGYGRSPIDFVLAPVRLVYDQANFGGRGNWINPLPLLGIFGALADRRRRIGLPLLVIAAAVYVVWFAGTQMGRLLLPATALLSVFAADVLIRAWRRFPLTRFPIAMVVALSVGIVVAVGLVRAERYFGDRDGFLQRESMNYDDIRWMNTHLDPSRDRVASSWKTCAYLRIPWMLLYPTYQVEIGDEELRDPSRLYAALKRQGFTHLWGMPGDFVGLGDKLELVHANPVSRLGGVRFFRQPPTVHTAIFAIR